MATKPSTVDHRRSLLAEAMQIIEAQYGDELLLDDIAHRIASSRRQVQRAFVETTGKTYRETLTAVRMREAARLLHEQRSTRIHDAARAVGYREPAQFAKAFRRAHGVSPSEYRDGGGLPDTGPVAR